MKSVPIPTNPRPRCPVCGTAVYSAAGIHPQCAVKVAEAPPPRKPPGTLNPPPAGTSSASG